MTDNETTKVLGGIFGAGFLSLLTGGLRVANKQARHDERIRSLEDAVKESEQQIHETHTTTIELKTDMNHVKAELNKISTGTMEIVDLIRNGNGP